MRPTRIALYIWSVIAILAAISYLYPTSGWHICDYKLRWRTLSDVLLLSSPDTLSTVSPDSVILIDTLSVNETASVVVKETPIVSVSEPFVTIGFEPFTDFFDALQTASTEPIRVIHYGDSQIEEDRITSVLRQKWQQQFGGGGVGLLPLHQTIPTRTIRQKLIMNGVVQTGQGGPKRYLVYGPRSMRLADTDSCYGVMGQVALLDSMLVPGSQDLLLTLEPFDQKLLPCHTFNRLRVLADSSVWVSSPDSIFASSLISDIHYPITNCQLHLQGHGRVWGISLESDTGVIVDNIPMRGCSGNIFTRIDSAQLASFYQETNTRLIILQFGGNMIPQTENQSTISGYVRHTMRQQVRYMRACAPNASILLIGPSDMSTNIDGLLTTYPLVPYMDRLMRQMAQEEKIAYWSIYEAMGGYNSMLDWHDKGLAGSDYVHFTRAGANKIGKQLYQWLDVQYKDYLNSETPETLNPSNP